MPEERLAKKDATSIRTLDILNLRVNLLYTSTYQSSFISNSILNFGRIIYLLGKRIEEYEGKNKSFGIVDNH